MNSQHDQSTINVIETIPNLEILNQHSKITSNKSRGSFKIEIPEPIKIWNKTMNTCGCNNLVYEN